MATPHATAVAVLLWSIMPSLTPEDVIDVLERTGVPVTDDLNDADPFNDRTTPRVDAQAAVLDDDFDQDGCSNEEELGDLAVGGGLRNPLHFWDFFDVWTGSPLARDRAVTITDIGGVVARFGASVLIPPIDPSAALTPPPPAPAYHAAFDRGGPFPGVDVWHLQPPDGSILIGDIGGVVAQFGHSCS